VYEVVELGVLYEKNTRLYHLSGLLAGLLIHAWTRRRQAWPSAGRYTLAVSGAMSGFRLLLRYSIWIRFWSFRYVYWLKIKREIMQLLSPWGLAITVRQTTYYMLPVI
jgi:hypothetical protein